VPRGERRRAVRRPHRPSRDLARLVGAVRLVVFDFDGVFTDNTVWVLEDGREAVQCWRGDGLGLRKLERLGIKTAILSSETNPVVGARAGKLQLRCEQGVDDKLAMLERLARGHNLTLAQVAFVGSDVNDLPCLSSVRLPVVVADAHAEVHSVAAYRTRARGGRGAVREVCDLFDRLRGQGAGRP
jgi:YrbI family 3-deoxy-D-manno-octulosonate 8-phosphate phosphatase